MTKAKIVDVSFWQGKIDWEDVVEDNVSGVIMKTSEADGVDTKFPTYWAEAKSVGLPRSTYHFYRERLTGTKQAQLAVSLLDKYGWGEWDNWLDFEIPAQNVAGINLAQGVYDYLVEFKRLTSKDAGIYTSPGYWQPLAQYARWAANYKLWVATYPWENYIDFVSKYSEHYNTIYEGNFTFPVIKNFPPPFLFQWTGHGRVQGITTNVDMNVYNGTKEEFYAAINFNQAPPPPPPQADSVYEWATDVDTYLRNPLGYKGKLLP
jgi:lysozyme